MSTVIINFILKKIHFKEDVAPSALTANLRFRKVERHSQYPRGNNCSAGARPGSFTYLSPRTRPGPDPTPASLSGSLSYLSAGARQGRATISPAAPVPRKLSEPPGTTGYFRLGHAMVR